MKKREMPAGLSRFLFVVILAASLVFLSCASKPSVAEFFLESGVQQYFVHQITLKKQGVKMQFDATIHVVDSKLVDNPVVRYSLYDEIYGQNPNNIILTFECEGKDLSCQNAKMLYKDVDLNSQRYEGEMQPDDFVFMANSDAPIFVVFTEKEGGNLLGKIETKEFRSALSKLKFVIPSQEN
ncbi:MAG: hypothetical protein K6A42_07160 [Treponema sp.]|nr:hypothetical protein [Treponema sp.]